MIWQIALVFTCQFVRLAVLFVGASMDITKGANYWHGSFRCDVSEIQRDLRWNNKKLTNLGSKDGLTLYSLKGEYSRWIYLRKNTGRKSIVGMIRLLKDIRHGAKVCASFITKQYRNKGLGQVLYLGAVHQYGTVKSSGNLGEMSLRIYKKLMKYHKVSVRDWNGRACKFEWPEDKEMPVVNGKKLDDTYYTYNFVVQKHQFT